ncbi:MAG: serine/threonine-protein phosphatase [Clostridia bacterium]|nr:serine/threonine-protein phosphatase [Clostridia bacterium]
MNQDRYLIRDFGDGYALCAVFDGMGGTNGGEEASAAALHAFDDCITNGVIDSLRSGVILSRSDAEKLLLRAAQTANDEIFRQGCDTDLQGMGTTVISAFILPDDVIALNVGDSRLYETSRGELRQVSKDNSYVQYLVDIGKITKEEAATHPNKNIITKCLGTEDTVEPDTYRIGELPEKLLLCSDGLTNALSEEFIFEVITDPSSSCEAKVTALIDAANRAGGPDNITVILAEND